MGLKWWQKAVFYQVYPRSFADGNGDGIGDFPGLTAKLDYLDKLGIDAIWLSPHYPSPLVDCGYDVCDYLDVAPEYGTLQDFAIFLQEAHARGLRVCLDLVLNHTSDQHPWFVESASSRDSPKRDWYVWRDGQENGPPNNWASLFGGPAWERDPRTNQYYYHAFLKEQPDLNWRNPEVKRAMWDTVRFWLDLGVDGFRLDAIGAVYEHPELPNHTLSRLADGGLDAPELNKKDWEQLMRFQVKQPGLHELMRELRAVVDEYPGDRVLVGEDDDVAFYGTSGDELHLVFNFPLMLAGRLTPEKIRANQATRLAALPVGAWPCNTLGNHDSSRVWSRYGDGVHDEALARLHLALLLTLKGTPFLYNGEEIGMSDLEVNSLSDLRDTTALNEYRVLTLSRGMAPDEALKLVAGKTRDRCRSPFQWSGAPNGGFSPPGATTWLPLNPDCARGVNVAAQEGDPTSLLSFYRRLLGLRKNTPALVAGDYQMLHPESETYLAFVRHDRGTRTACLVVLNFSSEAQSVRLHLGCVEPHVLFSSQGQVEAFPGLEHFVLEPFEVLVLNLT